MEQLQIQKTENINYLDLYIKAAWNLSYSAFWDQLDFSITEIETAKKSLVCLFQLVKILIAITWFFVKGCLWLIAILIKKYIPLPSTWFKQANEKGFIGTVKWMDSLKLKRKSIPLYRIELKALAEAVLEMTEDPTVANFRYWKSYLLERKQGILYYSLFVSVIMNGMLSSNMLNQKN